MDDVRVRLAAFAWLEQQQRLRGEVLPAVLLRGGFPFEGQRVPLMGPSGIWKPKLLADLPLSITTTWDSPYQDRLGEDDSFIYSFRDGEHVQNEYLRRAATRHTPLVYFHAVAKARYHALFPVFLVGVDEQAREIRVQVGDVRMPFAYAGIAGQAVLGVAEPLMGPEKAYRTVEAKVRVHQHQFREMVLHAYQRRCACCGFRHDELLDAAHIIEDRHEMGKPVVSNGLTLCSLHHRAFDRHFFGIDADGCLKVRPDLMKEKDGPTLEGIQKLQGQGLRVRPRHREDWPDRDALDQRFQQFLAACG
jgi:putative restriction endonuclease